MELELATFDLPLAIDNARTFVRERATKHGINLDVTVDERLGDFVGDEGRSNRFFSTFFPTLLSSRRREDGSELTRGRQMVQ